MVYRYALPLALLIGASLPTSAQAQAARADVAFVDRAEALALDESCHLFNARERRSLEAGLRQASATLMRTGVRQSQLDEELVRARRAAIRADCNHPDIQAAAEHIRQAFAGYLTMRQWQFDGRVQSWTADRNRLDLGGWALYQTLPQAQARFGLAFTDDGDGILLTGRTQTQMTGAALVLRDTSRSQGPYDATAGGILQPPGGQVLASYGPPPQAQTRIWASARMMGPLTAYPISENGEAPAPEAMPQVYSFRFPDDTLQRLAGLDPREGVKVELYGQDGRRDQDIWLEVGELRAAIDFLDAAMN
ncbi:hypothetical protein [Woodsholea maritima]|uniref:hypothetical protein n=1 Tax=Woodsholea maritima TaxID=240237 RepID=UPI000380D110|nr:hypothetical protein [Woodsholea maritima]